MREEGMREEKRGEERRGKEKMRGWHLNPKP